MKTNAWTVIGDHGTEVVTSPDDAVVYFISDSPLPNNKGSTLKQYSLTLGESEVFSDDQPPNIFRVKVDKFNYPWVVNTYGELYSFSGAEWILQGRETFDFGFKSESEVQTVNIYGELYLINKHERVYLTGASQSSTLSALVASNPIQIFGQYSADPETYPFTCSSTADTDAEKSWW